MSEANPFNNDIFNQVDAIVNSITSKPRIVQCIQACNEEQLIEACMLQLYDQVDQIVVIEGAVQNKVDTGQATPDGHSLDRTVEIIKDVKDNKDPDKKIIFVQIDRPWQDLEELKNTFFQYMREGDWMLITDADEFIMPDVIDKLRQAIAIEPWATEFVPSAFYHFWRDVHHIRKPSGDWGQQHQRFIKFQVGLNYVNHPVARDVDGVCTYFHTHYLGRRFVLSEFKIFHYSYCKDSEDDVRKKKEFYDAELGQAKHGDVGAYARGGQTDEYLDRTETPDTVLQFDGSHPPAVMSLDLFNRKDETPPVGCDNYMTASPYNLENVPLIWIFAVQDMESIQRHGADFASKMPSAGYSKLFNLVEV